jgi:hypothetical protein
MNRVCVEKSTGKLIEVQGGGGDSPELMEARLDTLRQNALNAGYTEEEIEVKWVTDEEWATIEAAQRQRDLDARPYGEKRKAEYAPPGDQLDNISKVLKYLIEHGVDVGPDGEAQVAMSEAVKAKYPKG